MIRRTLIIICCLVITPIKASILENQIFDTNRMKPVELLYEAYQKSSVLLIGTSNHSNFRHYERVLELLEIVWNDSNLKYIILERSHEISGFYELLSFNELEATLNKFTFSSNKVRKDNLCLNPEWSYTIREFMPKLREINRLRHPLNPIILKTVEGMPANLSPGPFNRVNDGTCNGAIFDTLSELELFALSRDRELITQTEFKKNIWDKLGKTEKVIYVSHYGHFIDGFKGCRPSKDMNGNWSANVEPITWLTPFFDSHPRAKDQFKLILIDEKDERYNPEGGLKLVQRQSRRYPGEDFAFPTMPFKDINKEIGTHMFMDNSTINQLKHYSNRSLDDIFYGVIWNANASVQSPLKTAYKYLPELCDTISSEMDN